MKLCLRALVRRSVICATSVAFLIPLAACSPKPQGGGVKTYQIPWPSASGQYEIQDIEIKTFSEPSKLKGDVAEIFVGPSNDNSTLEAPTGVGRFIENKDGVYIPADLATLQATTVYAHLERLYELDSKLGFVTSFLWPAVAGIKVNYSDPAGKLQNNAFYDGGLNAIVMVPYTSGDIPLTINAGVIAHEHFHAIFQEKVVRKIESRGYKSDNTTGLDLHRCALDEPVPDGGTSESGIRIKVFDPHSEKLSRRVSASEHNRILLRALNEGLADFWGWLYTGDSNFIVHSLSAVEDRRSLDAMMLPFAPVDKIHLAARQPRFALQMSYEMGSNYARFLKQLAIKQSSFDSSIEQSREVVAQALVAALDEIGDEFARKFDTEAVSSDMLVAPLFSRIASLKTESCELYDLVIAGKERPKPCVARTKSPAVKGTQP